MKLINALHLKKPKNLLLNDGRILNLGLVVLGFPSGSAGKESACNAGDVGYLVMEWIDLSVITKTLSYKVYITCYTSQERWWQQLQQPWL